MATSKLQRKTSEYLSRHLGQYTIRENHRPSWMNGLELDFFIDELNVGIEVQGRQHQEYIPFFHKNYDDFLCQQTRDREKITICNAMRVKLLYVFCSEDIIQAIEKISNVKFDWPTHPKSQEWVKFCGIDLPRPKSWKPSYVLRLMRGDVYKSICITLKKINKMGLDTKNIQNLAALWGKLNKQMIKLNDKERKAIYGEHPEYRSILEHYQELFILSK